MSGLSFTVLREQSTNRCARWHGPDWCSPDDPWSLADWANAMGGEAGEAQNIVKKIRRIETGLWDAQKYPGDSPPGDEIVGLDSMEARVALQDKLANEIADVVLYADLLAAKAGIDLETAIREKFNRVSEAQGFPERL